MQKIGIVYSKYFNEQNNRSGILFQGTYKKVLIEDDNQLMYLLAYVNANNVLHGVRSPHYRSSINDYFALSKNSLVEKDLVLENFVSDNQWQEFCKEKATEIKQRRLQEKTYWMVD